MSARLFYLCLFSAIAVLSPPSSGDSNLLTNPGFETGNTSGWNSSGSSISAVTAPHSGTYSALVTGRSSAHMSILSRKSTTWNFTSGTTTTTGNQWPTMFMLLWNGMSNEIQEQKRT
jgi:hypothetical protein